MSDELFEQNPAVPTHWQGATPSSELVDASLACHPMIAHYAYGSPPPRSDLHYAVEKAISAVHGHWSPSDTVNAVLSAVHAHCEATDRDPAYAVSLLSKALDRLLEMAAEGSAKDRTQARRNLYDALRTVEWLMDGPSYLGMAALVIRREIDASSSVTAAGRARIVELRAALAHITGLPDWRLTPCPF